MKTKEQLLALLPEIEETIVAKIYSEDCIHYTANGWDVSIGVEYERVGDFDEVTVEIIPGSVEAYYLDDDNHWDELSEKDMVEITERIHEFIAGIE